MSADPFREFFDVLLKQRAHVGSLGYEENPCGCYLPRDGEPVGAYGCSVWAGLQTEHYDKFLVCDQIVEDERGAA